MNNPASLSFNPLYFKESTFPFWAQCSPRATLRSRKQGESEGVEGESEKASRRVDFFYK